METILFRAKRLDNGEWIQGSYVKDAYTPNKIIEHGIQEPRCYPVEIDPETLGQYRPDVKAFDGDWLQVAPQNSPDEVIEGVLFFDCMECQIETPDDSFPVLAFCAVKPGSAKNTGKNIHDNPELLPK